MKGTPRKVRKFAEGGFSDAQEEWLTRGGQSPDRTDPYILARMRSAVPDEPKKNNYIPNKDSAMDNKDVGSNKPEPFESGFEETEGINAVSKPTTGGKTKVPVVKETTKTTVVAPAKTYDDQNSRRAPPIKSSSAIDTDDPEYKKKPFLERLKLESGAAYNDAKNKIKNTTAEDLASTALGMFPAFRGIKALAAGKNAFDRARNVTPKPDQIGMDAKRIGMDARRQIGMNPRQIGMNPRKQLELDKSGQSNRASSSGAMKDDFKPGDLRSDFKKGGKIKKMASGGKVSSASKRADGCAIRGKTRA